MTLSDKTFPGFDGPAVTLSQDAMIAISDDEVVSFRELVGAWRVLNQCKPDPNQHFTAYELVLKKDFQ